MSNARILVVDDDQVIQQLLKVNLELEGYAVEVERPGRGRPLEGGPEQPSQVTLDGEDGGGHDTPGVAAPRSCWAMIPATRCRSWIGSNGLVT